MLCLESRFWLIPVFRISLPSLLSHPRHAHLPALYLPWGLCLLWWYQAREHPPTTQGNHTLLCSLQQDLQGPQVWLCRDEYVSFEQLHCLASKPVALTHLISQLNKTFHMNNHIVSQIILSKFYQCKLTHLLFILQQDCSSYTYELFKTWIIFSRHNFNESSNWILVTQFMVFQIRVGRLR